MGRVKYKGIEIKQKKMMMGKKMARISYSQNHKDDNTAGRG